MASATIWIPCLTGIGEPDAFPVVRRPSPDTQACRKLTNHLGYPPRHRLTMAAAGDLPGLVMTYTLTVTSLRRTDLQTATVCLALPSKHSFRRGKPRRFQRAETRSTLLPGSRSCCQSNRPFCARQDHSRRFSNRRKQVPLRCAPGTDRGGVGQYTGVQRKGPCCAPQMKRGREFPSLARSPIVQDPTIRSSQTSTVWSHRQLSNVKIRSTAQINSSDQQIRLMQVQVYMR